MEEKYLVRNQTLTTLVSFLNKELGTKRSGTNFTLADVQQYIKNGALPQYLGGNKIEIEEAIDTVKLYRLKNKL